MKRADYQASSQQFVSDSSDAVVGSLTANSFFAVDLKQRNAWLAIVAHLKTAVANLKDAYIFLEFTIPRMGRRVDAVILSAGCVFVLEYKIGSEHFYPADIDQVVGYALDLKNFHEPSHVLPIFPILIATNAESSKPEFQLAEDRVCKPILSNGTDLSDLLCHASALFPGVAIDPPAWADGRYKPTPTIIEAAQALYRNHRVDDITRNEAGIENLTETAAYVSSVIENSKRMERRQSASLQESRGRARHLRG